MRPDSQVDPRSRPKILFTRDFSLLQLCSALVPESAIALSDTVRDPIFPGVSVLPPAGLPDRECGSPHDHRAGLSAFTAGNVADPGFAIDPSAIFNIQGSLSRRPAFYCPATPYTESILSGPTPPASGAFWQVSHCRQRPLGK